MPLGPSASPRPTAPAVVAPDVMSGWWYTLGDPAKHVGLVVAALKNESTEPVTVSGLTVSGAGGIRAVLTPMVSAVPKDTTISIGYLRKLDLPSPASVLLPPGRSMFVVISVPATCTTADDEVSASITVSLRSASGGTKDLVLPADAGPPTGWVRSGRAAACPQPSTG